MKKMTIPAWLKSGPVRGLLQVLLWCVALTFLMVVLYTFDSRGELHERMVQWRIPLLVWRLALYCILITLWLWPGGLRQRYAGQVRSSSHSNPRFAVFRIEIIPVLLIAFSEYSTWTQ
ncbi:hypothetical protein LDS28_002711 [Salmonella enterica]|uniref:Uncharacterized protein n=1 Tax=Salmonella enterica TaxID=28901 RepID=A0A627ETX8_SALER|nr:hypothetical protein [Salmonella enterica]EDU2594958.1 hypothetical protein [Salmonella enterica subsp. enterica serovar Sandiego]EDX3512013.1 hypothetical protein [Salmonella enterica subsp. enterica serovar Adelaide]EHA8879363.1 hypothetical protein [Salmonella enterica subsp. enterica serovar Infantis]EHG9470302.1 hypothetical protein [Salmonella enterica subsp. enterica serovar Newport]EIG0951421.1 hypothetical protein [Salmonella enterica subsp. enterica serovar Muenchen]